MGAFTRKDAFVRTKRLWLLLVAIIVTLGGFTPVVGLGVNAVFTGHYLGAALSVVALFAAEFGLLHLWNKKWLERRGALRADEQGLWLDEVIVVPRSTLQHGDIVRRDGVTYVRLFRMLQPVEIVVEDASEGAALLAAMRLDSLRSVGHFTMSQGTLRGAWIKAGAAIVPIFAFLAGALFVTSHAEVLLASFLVLNAPLLLWSLNQFVRVSVGADGIRLRRLLSRPRFVPFAAVRGAELVGAEVHIRLHDGTVETMHHQTSSKGWKPLLYRDRADEGQMLVDRINEQIARHAALDGATVSVVGRGARATRAWLREVALVSDEHASFRAPAFPADELWRVVEDPVASTTARAGAALALRARLDDAGRTRLRVAADACAAPKLRIALESVASDAKPESLEDAFDALEDEPNLHARTRET